MQIQPFNHEPKGVSAVVVDLLARAASLGLAVGLTGLSLTLGWTNAPQRR